MTVFSATAQTSTNLIVHTKPAAVPAALMPPPSPIDYFRHLLVLSPQQRESALAGKSPVVRTKILAKVNEYAALDPNEREVRLEATELRWYLVPLMHAAPADRDTQLARVPVNIRVIVTTRLMQWEILPPGLQREFLENEHVLGYFSGLDSTNNPAGATAPTSDEQSRWDALPASERNAMLGQFNQFFALSPAEKQKAIGGLSNIERAQMEKVIGTLNGLPPLQRAQCLRACAKFASMTPQQRAEFMKDAQRWSEMSPAERKAWADLATHVPEWAPAATPSVLMPPAMPAMPPVHPNFHPLNATNHS
ncbi:MAG TPA: DUF3106 domain-containing protein [Pseudomonadales bacterium]|nr:DUF3106 domain-containing protein [Pseudomonadales bacterium]